MTRLRSFGICLAVHCATPLGLSMAQEAGADSAASPRAADAEGLRDEPSARTDPDAPVAGGDPSPAPPRERMPEADGGPSPEAPSDPGAVGEGPSTRESAGVPLADSNGAALLDRLEGPDAEGLAADDGDYVELSLEELLDIPVVTASGGEEETTRSAAANVIVISAKDIARHRWRSLAEVLSVVPGLHVIDDLVQPALSVRGISGGLRSGTRLVKIMINGVEVAFRPDLTAFIGREYLPIEAIDRVEIVKGPLSAIYGANAFLATINVITKTPEEGSFTSMSARGHAQQSSSTAGYGVSMLSSYADDELSLLAAFSSDRVDRSGLHVIRTFPEQSSDLSQARFQHLFARESTNDVSRPSTAYLQVGYQSAAWGNLTAQGGYQDLDSTGEFLLNSVTTGASKLHLYNFWSHLDHGRHWLDDRLESHLGVGYATGAPREDTRLYLAAGDPRYYVPEVDYQAVDVATSLTATFERLRLKLGGDLIVDDNHVLLYRQVPVDGSDSGQDFSNVVRDRTLTTGGAYLGVRTNPIPSLERLSVAGDVRVDYLHYDDEAPPLQLSWRLGTVYEFDELLTAKIIAGRAFQGPSATLLFAERANFGFGNDNNVIGQRPLRDAGLTNRSLVPQTAQSVELMLGSTVAGTLSLQAGAFYQKIENQILFVPNAANFVAKNEGTTSFLGFEGSARLLFDRLVFSVSGSYLMQLDAERDTIPEFPGYQLVGTTSALIPEVFAQVSAVARVTGARGSSAGNSTLNNLTPYELDPWAEMDASITTLGWQPLPLGGPTLLALTIRNLLNTQYSEPGFGGFDMPARGRTFLVEVEQRL